MYDSVKKNKGSVVSGYLSRRSMGIENKEQGWRCSIKGWNYPATTHRVQRRIC